MGAALACGVALGLDDRKMQHALGFGYSQSTGNRQALIEGALAKRIQPGFAAAAGLRSAIFASEGLTAARELGSGEFGLYELYVRDRSDSPKKTLETEDRFRGFASVLIDELGVTFHNK